MAQVAVIGGGVVGLCGALSLRRAGHRVVLFDDDADGRAASWNNAGHLAIEQVVPLASPATLRSAWRRRFSAGGALDLPLRMTRAWLPFALRFIAASSEERCHAGTAALESLLVNALPAWQRCADSVGRPELVRTDGHFIAWERAYTASAGAANWQRARTGAAQARAATAAELQQLRELAPSIAGAIRFDSTGQIADLGALRIALEAALHDAGGEIVRKSVAPVAANGAVAVPGYAADYVVVAAGVRSRELLHSLGHAVPMIAERGYHIRASAEHWPAALPPLVFEDRSLIVTRFRAQVQAASFVEFGAPDGAPDPRKWQRLEQHVRELRLPITGPFTRWMGARPTLPDYLPALGRSRRLRNLCYAFGHQHLGLTLAAITAEHLVNIVQGQRAAIDLAPFDIARFE